MRKSTPTPDEFATTQPIMETLLKEMRDIGINVRSIQKHLDEQDKKIDGVRSQTNLAGNIASESLRISEETRDIVRRIDQNLTGIYELAKSGFDIATAIRSAQDTEPPSVPDLDPEIEIDGRRFHIVGTGN